MKNFSVLFLIVLVINPLQALAWGRRGHQIVGEEAALVVAQLPDAGFLLSHSFDIGYYANVPDFFWKKPATYEFEKPQHFMDMEIFEREFKKHPEIEHPFELNRKEFEAKFKDVPLFAGRAFWRIRELNDELSRVTKELRDLKEEVGPARQKLQERWLLVAGVMAHYVGDLSMPLHVSENYDGQLSGQKGIHSYFEDLMVDQLFPSINCEVNREAKKQWSAFTKKNSSKSILELLEQLGNNSTKAISVMLDIDKKSGREDIKKNSERYHGLIRTRLVDSTLTLAEIYRRQLGWKFDDNRFFYFDGEPAYMMPDEKLGPVPVPAKPAEKK